MKITPTKKFQHMPGMYIIDTSILLLELLDEMFLVVPWLDCYQLIAPKI